VPPLITLETLPTTPLAVITAMSFSMPSSDPLSSVHKARLFTAAGTDYLGGDSLIDKLFLKPSRDCRRRACSASCLSRTCSSCIAVFAAADRGFCWRTPRR